eukprot:12944710-Ditylum_brightwellii.AAC.1
MKETTTMAKRHMDQKRQNLQSTKKQQFDDDDDAFPMGGIGNKTYEYASTVIPLTPKMKAYIDPIGHLPHKSLRGNQY